ncbi:Protein of unknown function [Pyronema omphalodes CBS 100304]|uniref:Uncharacterized protein n=1 Tax=Pyronema omphalodes (strain CBS 100304) TaxID=1076935 RepID=U4KWP3_PYROM|nr:Protein of unknown function [Pyronema omphalodes CBS 100304]
MSPMRKSAVGYKQNRKALKANKMPYNTATVPQGSTVAQLQGQRDAISTNNSNNTTDSHNTSTDSHNVHHDNSTQFHGNAKQNNFGGVNTSGGTNHFG